MRMSLLRYFFPLVSLTIIVLAGAVWVVAHHYHLQSNYQNIFKNKSSYWNYYHQIRAHVPMPSH